MRPMRNAKREVKDEKYIDEIILACDCCRLGMIDGDEVYIVPLNFGYENENGKKVFYFHGAKEGRKIDLIGNGAKVGFELDRNHELKSADTACDFAFVYQSVIGNGKAVLLEDKEEKAKGLKSIMKHYTGKTDWEMKDQVINSTAVIKLEVEALSCKEIPRK